MNSQTRKFSLATLLLLLSLAATGVYIVVQNIEHVALRSQVSVLKSELGWLTGQENKVLVRALADRDGINTWRYRIWKPTKNYQYCFGVVDLDESASPILPVQYRPYFQPIDCNSAGHSEILLSLWRNTQGRWRIQFHEFEGDETKEATATRIDMFSENILDSVWQLDGGEGIEVQNEISQLVAGSDSNGPQLEFDDQERVLLFRSELPGQTGDKRKAFVLALRPMPNPQQDSDPDSALNRSDD